MYGQKMSGKIHENSLPGSLKLRFSSPMVEKVEEEPVPVVPIWVWQVLFYVLCLTKNITELIVDIYCHADLVSLCRWSLEGQSRVLS